MMFAEAVRRTHNGESVSYLFSNVPYWNLPTYTNNDCLITYSENKNMLLFVSKFYKIAYESNSSHVIQTLIGPAQFKNLTARFGLITLLIFQKVNTTVCNTHVCNDEKGEITTRNTKSSNVNKQLRIQGLTKQIISSIRFYDCTGLPKRPFVVSWSPTLIR